MRKTKMILAIAASVVALQTQAQWTKVGAVIAPTVLTDNVSVGTTVNGANIYAEKTGAVNLGIKSTTLSATMFMDKGSATANAAFAYKALGVTQWNSGILGNNNFSIRNVILGTNPFIITQTDRFGLSTGTPQNKLDIEGSLAVGATYSGTNAAPLNGAIIEGNVGIGTSSPARTLHIALPATQSGLRLSNAGNLSAGFELLTATGGTPNDAYVWNWESAPMFFGTSNTFRMTIAPNGNVGIGTTAPATKLDILGPGNWDLSTTQGDVRIGDATYNIRMGVALAGGGAGYSTIAATSALQLGTGSTYPNLNTLNILGGQVGIGTTTPNAKLDVMGSVRLNDNAIYLRGSTNTDHFLAYDATVNGPLLSGYDGGQLGGTQPTTIALRWLWNGNVGIGTVTPAYKLDVCGTIRAKEVRIETGWCDYVFAKDYKLKTIDEVEAFIEAHKHLPGIVPASQVESEGMKVGEMSKAMMEKIEELTLYLIDQKNQINELKKQNQLQQQQIDNLKK